MKQQYIVRLLLVVIMIITMGAAVSAQRFAVESFKVLSNDVTAFIEPVNDLNDEACGLIKVMAADDFVFSTPLGIVKRIDKIGEIWLFVPKGTKKLTIKHADLGVLRDYVLPVKVESHVSYELRLDTPLLVVSAAESVHPVTTVHDTLVVTRIDTLVVTAPRKVIPREFDVLLTGAYGGRAKTFVPGVMFVAMKRHGGFFHVSTNFGRIGHAVGSCDKEGYVGEVMPFYSGRKRHSTLMLNAGAAHRLSDKVAIFEGLGYSSSAIAWELAPSEGGGFVKNTYYSQSGISFEVGALVRLGRVRLSASVISIRGKEWYGSIGIGLLINKI